MPGLQEIDLSAYAHGFEVAGIIPMRTAITENRARPARRFVQLSDEALAVRSVRLVAVKRWASGAGREASLFEVL